MAILLVMLQHARVPGFIRGGTAGVTLFFVLSGFLITTLLIAEHDRHGRVSLRKFWIRRGARLLPALLPVLVVAVGFAAVTATVVAGLKQAGVALFYVANWWLIADQPMGVLPHTWSLSVEEQFYLAFPLLLVLVAGRAGSVRRAVVWVAGVGLALSVAARALLLLTDSSAAHVQHGTDTNTSSILVGCLLAVALPRLRVAPDWRAPVAAAGALVVIVAVVVAPMSRVVEDTYGYAALLGACVLLVAAAAVTPRMRVLAWAPVVLIGQISYSAYLWNFPLARGARYFQLGEVGAVAAFVGTLVVAFLSWKLLERPVLRWARQYGTVHATERPAAVGSDEDGREREELAR